MAPMTEAAIQEFLQEARHAILATNRPAGPPQLTPVWYLYADGVFYVSAQVDTVKVRNLRRDPAVSLCVDGGRGDERYVVVTGRAKLVEPGEPPQEEMRWRIIRHYSADEESARRYYESVRDHAAALIVITPERIISQDFS
ncbi:MAG: PPOX class F420-dependent oxidoreductase [Caldilineae bacterium]|nr:MAG: PPOX class F420-dependent oxidoreductase [Caldilineae bacterium]